MTCNSEARKRSAERMDLDHDVDIYSQDFPDTGRLLLRQDGMDALLQVYATAEFDEWDALVDQLEERGLRVVRA